VPSLTLQPSFRQMAQRLLPKRKDLASLLVNANANDPEILSSTSFCKCYSLLPSSQTAHDRSDCPRAIAPV